MVSMLQQATYSSRRWEDISVVAGSLWEGEVYVALGGGGEPYVQFCVCVRARNEELRLKWGYDSV